jgi:hypothetical protein
MVAMPDAVEALAQILPLAKKALDRIEPLLTQPFRRQPYVMPLSTSAVIPAGASNQPLRASDFSHNLEWDFEVHRIKFSQDGAHNMRDWRFKMIDIIVAQELFKASAMVATLVLDNTGAWDY